MGNDNRRASGLSSVDLPEPMPAADMVAASVGLSCAERIAPFIRGAPTSKLSPEPGGPWAMLERPIAPATRVVRRGAAPGGRGQSRRPRPGRKRLLMFKDG